MVPSINISGNVYNSICMQLVGMSVSTRINYFKVQIPERRRFRIIKGLEFQKSGSWIVSGGILVCKCPKTEANHKLQNG